MILTSLILLGTINTFANAFPTDPYYTDDFGDDTSGAFEDIKYIWVDNNETFLMFRIEFAGPFNDTIANGIYCRVFISVDNNTGTLHADFLSDYSIRLMTLNPDWYPSFNDDGNSSNNVIPISSDSGLLYFLQSNNNHTLEIGYKLQSSYTGKGYLNVSLGQTINLKFEMGWTSDWAPDIGEGNLSYTLKLPAPTLAPILPNPSTNGTVKLNWNSIRSATNYYIYRDTSIITSTANMIPIATTAETSYTENLSTNGDYYYAVIAENDLTNSSLSNCVAISIHISSPGIPSFNLFTAIIGLSTLIAFALRKEHL